jgi:hypothetical protein
MSSNDLVYSRESLAQDAARHAAIMTPVFLPVAEPENVREQLLADLANPVAWHTTKSGRVRLLRAGEAHPVEFYVLIGDELVLGCADRRWIFNPVVDALSIQAPLMTADLQRLQSYTEMLIEKAR